MERVVAMGGGNKKQTHLKQKNCGLLEAVNSDLWVGGWVGEKGVE